MDTKDLNDLRWYLYDATLSEFNGKAVDDIIDRLNIRDSILADVQCLKLNQSDDTADKRGDKKPGTAKIIGTVTGFVAAAALLAITVIGISNKPVIADPDTGFFHVLKEDEEGREFIGDQSAVMGQQLPSIIDPSPTKGQVDATPEDSEFFADLKSIFFIPSEIPGDLIMTSYEGLSLPGSTTKFHSHYENDYNDLNNYRYVVIGLSSDTTISSNQKLSGSKKIAGLEVHNYTGKYTGDHSLIFGDGSVVYYVDGNIDLSDLEDIMEQYIEFLRNNGVI